MNFFEHKITLDMHSSISQLSISVKKGDTKRKICATLTENGKVCRLEDGCTAVFSAKKDNAALALVLCLTMGLPLQEICALRWEDVECNNQSIPLTLHIGGTTKISNKRLTSVPYAKDPSF